ncbi:MAG: haloacid dehalogenase [Chloroflexi bacterium]|nr:haloacid dehalogenase [Chloroflexota bacterium]
MSDLPTANLEQIADRIREALSRKNQAREAAYPVSRHVVRNAANAIRAVHRGEFEVAQKLLTQARELLEQIKTAVADYPDLLHAGYVDTAEKEYAEASVTMALASQSPLPDPESLGVGDSAYLNGLGEAVGEMRRHLLDALRQERIARCEEVLVSMDDIYNVLVTIDFPDALTGNLRRTTDMVRGVLERTRGDLTAAIVQSRLADKLGRIESRLTEKD